MGIWIKEFRLQILGFVGWPLDFELCTLDSGLWFLEFRSRFSQKPKVLRLWALEFVFWSWDFGFWSLDSGLWIFHFALWLSDFGILVFGLCALD